MESVNRLRSCLFEPLADVELPDKALIWTKQQYYDGSGWLALNDHNKLALKPTLFADNRLIFLEPTDGICEVFSGVQSGNYDVKCWTKHGCHVGIEGDKNVFISLPNLREVAIYVHPDRLPAFPKSWKPLLFRVNERVVTFRMTDSLSLVVTIEEDNTVKIQCVNYNDGFMAAHPANDMALAYGAYAVKGFDALPNCQVLPRISASSGDWGFFMQFYPWGSALIAKSIELMRPASVLGVGLGKKVDCLGLVFHPPNLFLTVHLECPKVQRELVYGRDYLLTAIKSSETDIDVYLTMDNQLIKYNHSFDIRINKPDKPKTFDSVIFKCLHEVDDKKKVVKFNFVNTKNATVLMPEGSPSSSEDHLVSADLIAIYDAEICMYLTHPPALRLCKAFESVALLVD